jgi:serine protease
MHKLKTRSLLFLCVTSLYACFPGASIAAAGTNPEHDRCNGRIIVKFKDNGKGIAQLNKQQITRLQIAGKSLSVTPRRLLSNGAHLIQRSKITNQQTDAEYIKQLNQDPDIEYAECDARRKIHYMPADPFFADQWYLSLDDAGGINAEQAWDTSLTQSINPTVIAVVDTGLANHNSAQLHEDLDGSRILNGYDFVSEDAPNNFFTANDGDGRDNDPGDPGDATDANECNAGDPAEDTTSSWHGTAITGIIAAELDNNIGIAGIDHNSRILPARALGKCGGFTSDIADAIRWAAGGSINGVPDNPDPAAVINLSFGSIADCSVTEQQAIDAAVAAGALVVVAAGNEGLDIDNLAPANCNNVLVVMATTQQGGETCYTNFGARADIAAPGGNSTEDASSCAADDADTIITISNAGATDPSPVTDSYSAYVGTSFSAPMVSAAIGLVKGANATLTNIEIESLLISTARSFPQGTTDSFRDCNTQRCGTGILDIRAAVELAADVDITPDSFSFNNQNNVTLNAVVSSNNITVSGINVLSPISMSGGEYSINNGSYTTAAGWIASGDTASLRVTAAGTGSTTRTAALNIGGVSANFTVTTQESNPPSLGGGDGGGGSVTLLLLGYFISLLCVRSCCLRRTPKKLSPSHL